MTEHPIRYGGYIDRPTLWALNEACRPIRAAIDMPYLVGSVMERPDFRDVDVRVILDDEEYDATPEAVWTLLGFLASRHLAAVTGLPVDFQIQRRTDANAAYGNRPRNPLGIRTMTDWVGDQRPPPAQDSVE